MDRSEIFQRAWYLFKYSDCGSFSNCLKKAWKEAKTPASHYDLNLPESSYQAQLRAIKNSGFYRKTA